MQLELSLEFEPWSGYGWITFKGRRLYAMVYHTWGMWFAQARVNPVLRRDVHGTVDRIPFGERIEEFTTRKDE